MSRPLLDIETVLAIRTSGASNRTLARELGVGHKVIYDARNGYTYKYVGRLQTLADMQAQALVRKRAGRPRRCAV